MKHALTLALPLIAAALAVLFSLPQSLGAHPQWAITVILIGTPIGIILAYALNAAKLPQPLCIAIGAVLTAVAFFTARYGRAEFGASFAEDQFAGQLWYYGWITTSAGVALTLASLALHRNTKA